jgi:hypothetical protein
MQARMCRLRSPGSWLLFLAVVCAVPVTSGCGNIRETRVCRAIARELNPALDEIEQLAKKPGVENHRRIAERYAKLAARMKQLTPPEGNMKSALEEYASILAATDAAIRAHNEANGANGAKQNNRVLEARRELERLVRREKAATSRIAAECRS